MPQVVCDYWFSQLERILNGGVVTAFFLERLIWKLTTYCGYVPS